MEKNNVELEQCLTFIMLIYSGTLFMGAVFDIDWVLEKMRADRYGRVIARVIYGIIGFVGLVICLTMIYYDLWLY
jgi:hypothetical protein